MSSLFDRKTSAKHNTAVCRLSNRKTYRERRGRRGRPDAMRPCRAASDRALSTLEPTLKGAPGRRMDDRAIFPSGSRSSPTCRRVPGPEATSREPRVSPRLRALPPFPFNRGEGVPKRSNGTVKDFARRPDARPDASLSRRGSPVDLSVAPACVAARIVHAAPRVNRSARGVCAVALFFTFFSNTLATFNYYSSPETIRRFCARRHMNGRARGSIARSNEKPKITLNGGSLGSWVDEERS